MTYMLTTWHTVSLEMVQSQVTLFANIWSSDVVSSHPDCPVHGSTSKFQFVFPNVFAMSRKACTAKVSKSSHASDQIRSILKMKRLYPNPTNQRLELHGHEWGNYGKEKWNKKHLHFAKENGGRIVVWRSLERERWKQWGNKGII